MGMVSLQANVKQRILILLHGAVSVLELWRRACGLSIGGGRFDVSIPITDGMAETDNRIFCQSSI